MRIGYAGVSTANRNPDLQEDALQKAGCEKIFRDVAGGAANCSKGFADALAYARGGDTLVVWQLESSRSFLEASAWQILAMKADGADQAKVEEETVFFRRLPRARLEGFPLKHRIRRAKAAGVKVGKRVR